MFPSGIGSGEMMVLLIIAVLLFGSKLPDVMRNLGKAYSQFRRNLTDFQFSIEDPDSRPNRYSASSSSSNANITSTEVDEDDDEPTRSTSAPRFQAPASDDE